MTITVILWLVFSCGIVLERYVGVDGRILSFFSIAAFIASFIFLKTRRLFYVFFIAAVFLTGAMSCFNALHLPPDSIVFIRPCQKKDAVIHVFVSSDPVVSAKKVFFPAKVDYVYSPCGSQAVCGRVMIEDALRRSYRFGDELVLKGRLRSLCAPAKGKGVVFSFDVDADGLLTQPVRDRGQLFKRTAFWMRRQAMALIAGHMNAQGTRVLFAMLLGEQRFLPQEMKKTMIRAGVWHIVVVSGSHVALMIAMTLLFLKVLFIPHRGRVCLAIVVLWLYCFLSGSSVSVVRAALMSSLFLTGLLLERKPHFYNTFFLTALAILILDPLELFAVGFQLSFTSVFFIVWLAPRIKNVFSLRFLNLKATCRMVEYFCVAVSAWLGTIPVLSCHFGGFSVIAVLANMIIVPLGALIVSSGFALVLFAAVLKPAAFFIAQASLCFIEIFIKTSRFFSVQPFAYIANARMPLGGVLVFYALLFLFGLILERRKKADPEDSRGL